MASWKKISSKTVYSSPYFKVKQDKVIKPDGKAGIYHLIESFNAVAIAALDAQNNIYLLREEKYISGTIWTIPAGRIEKGETPLVAAKRELKEEAGLLAGRWIDLGSFLMGPGHIRGGGHCFLAQDLKEGKQSLEPTEKIEVFKIPFEKAVQMIKNGEILDAWAIIPIFKAKLFLGL